MITNPFSSNSSLLTVARCIADAGGRLLVVGGAVRDMLLEVEPKDIDCEVFGLWPHEYLPILERYGQVTHRGLNKFPTYALRLEGLDVEFSSPRHDNKTGDRHNEFDVDVDPFMSITDAARRRDFTFNSMSYDPLTGELFDPFNGQVDLDERFLEVTDAAHFGEDPLRVPRGMQFCGRYGLISTRNTNWICMSILGEAQHLSKDSIWLEWAKWAQRSTVPSAGLLFLECCGWLQLYPALNNLRGVEQDGRWHPEGDVWSHTMHVVNAMTRLCDRKDIHGRERIVRMFAALCHDMGKVTTTVKGDDGRIRSIGHEKAGVKPAREFLESIGCPEAVIEQVVALVAEHMNYKGALNSKKALRKLAHRLYPATIRQLCDVVWADHAGRPPLPPDREDVLAELLKRAEADNCADDVPEVVKGRHLIAAGWTPGVHMGKALGQCYQAWLNGKFNTAEEGVRFAGKAK